MPLIQLASLIVSSCDQQKQKICSFSDLWMLDWKQTLLGGSKAQCLLPAPRQIKHITLPESLCGCEHPLPFDVRSHLCGVLTVKSSCLWSLSIDCRLRPPRKSAEHLEGATQTVPFSAFWQCRSAAQDQQHSLFCFLSGSYNGLSLISHIRNKGVTFQMWCARPKTHLSWCRVHLFIAF